MITYDPDCIVEQDSDSLYKCLAIIYDINGKKGPNQYLKDIGSINVKLDDSLDFEINEIFSPTPLNCTECENAKLQGAPITSCCDVDTDYFAGASYECYKEGKRLPNHNELTIIAQKLYKDEISYPGTTSNLKIADENLWTQFNNQNNFYWASEHKANNAEFRSLLLNATSVGIYSRDRGAVKAFCIE